MVNEDFCTQCTVYKSVADPDPDVGDRIRQLGYKNWHIHNLVTIK
jgi:hypothetical protein